MLGPLILKSTLAEASDAEGWYSGLTFPVTRQALTGSVFFFGTGNDVDVLVETPLASKAAVQLVDAGWEVTLGYDLLTLASGWFAARKGLVNLLVMQQDSGLYDKWMTARGVCAHLATAGLLLKEDKPTRANIHAIILGELDELE